MKKIEAIISPSRVAAVLDTLERRGIEVFTLSEVWTTAAGPRYAMLYRATVYAVDLVPRAKLEAVCSDAYALPVAYAITDAARTGRADDGDVLIFSVEDGMSNERADQIRRDSPSASCTEMRSDSASTAQHLERTAGFRHRGSSLI
jgi:nitrogen regulatory protein PII